MNKKEHLTIDQQEIFNDDSFKRDESFVSSSDEDFEEEQNDAVDTL